MSRAIIAQRHVLALALALTCSLPVFARPTCRWMRADRAIKALCSVLASQEKMRLRAKGAVARGGGGQRGGHAQHALAWQHADVGGAQRRPVSRSCCQLVHAEGWKPL